MRCSVWLENIYIFFCYPQVSLPTSEARLTATSSSSSFPSHNGPSLKNGYPGSLPAIGPHDVPVSRGEPITTLRNHLAAAAAAGHLMGRSLSNVSAAVIEESQAQQKNTRQLASQNEYLSPPPRVASSTHQSVDATGSPLAPAARSPLGPAGTSHAGVTAAPSLKSSSSVDRDPSIITSSHIQVRVISKDFLDDTGSFIYLKIHCVLLYI